MQKPRMPKLQNQKNERTVFYCLVFYFYSLQCNKETGTIVVFITFIILLIFKKYIGKIMFRRELPSKMIIGSVAHGLVMYDQKPVDFYLKITERAPTIQVFSVDFRSS